MNVLIAGGSGFLGKALSKLLYDQGFHVIVLTRNTFTFNVPGIKPHYWNIDTQTIDLDAFKEVDAVINLAGENIGDKRWSAEQKLKITRSRIASSELLYKTISKLEQKPKVYISASAVGYYGYNNGNMAMDETKLAGADFLAHVCSQWEEAAKRFNQLHIRTCIVRTGVVLSSEGGALKKITAPLKLNTLTQLGTGQQPFPWIHVDDLCHIYLHLLKTPFLSGTYNAVAPSNNTYNDLLKAISESRRIPPLKITIPESILYSIMGEMATIVLKGSYVNSSKIENVGYSFKYPTLQDVFKPIR